MENFKRTEMTEREKRNYAAGMQRERIWLAVKEKREKKPSEYYQAFNCAESKRFMCKVGNDSKMCEICRKEGFTK